MLTGSSRDLNSSANVSMSALGHRAYISGNALLPLLQLLIGTLGTEKGFL